MGISTNGHIFYGICFEEGFEFPWGDEEIEEWWTYKVHGFKHSFELYDAEGNNLNGVKPHPDLVTKYFQERRDFDATQEPLPVALVNYCSDSYPMYAIVVPSTALTARRGYPTAFDPGSLYATIDERAALKKFIEDHMIKTSSLADWFLASYTD